jgi:branched-chain amino acid aminotransferase
MSAAASPSHVWINGHVLPAAVARLSPFDHGWLVGDGAFETLVARGGKPFAVRRHYQRLLITCAALGIDPPSAEVFRQALHAAMQAVGLSEARLRFTISSGDGPMGSDKGDSPPTMTAVAVPVPTWPAAAKLCVVPWTRNENGALAGLKTTSYADNVRALAHAKAQGCGEAIFANTRGDLCEGTGSNVFIISGQTLATPPASAGCLLGIVRGLVIEATRARGISVEERPISMAEFPASEEAFITSSTRDVMPVSHINGRALGQVPGALTAQAAAALAELMARDFDP